MYDLLKGTVQGSILGPILYEIFLSSLFHIADFALSQMIPLFLGGTVHLSKVLYCQFNCTIKEYDMQ
jgi:hypothetical protein